MPEKISKSIFQIIPEIMKEISPIDKSKQNKQQGYSYRGVDDVMNELAPLMAKHGVFPTMRAIGALEQTSVESKTGTKGYHTTRTYEIFLYGPDGTFVSGIMDGEAVDFGDKSVGKCSSYAYRDFLIKTFVIPTAEPKDTDVESHELKAKPQPSKEAVDARPEMSKVAMQKLIDRIMLGEDDNVEEGEQTLLDKADAAMKIKPAQRKMIEEAYAKHNAPE